MLFSLRSHLITIPTRSFLFVFFLPSFNQKPGIIQIAHTSNFCMPTEGLDLKRANVEEVRKSTF